MKLTTVKTPAILKRSTNHSPRVQDPQLAQPEAAQAVERWKREALRRKPLALRAVPIALLVQRRASLCGRRARRSEARQAAEEKSLAAERQQRKRCARRGLRPSEPMMRMPSNTCAERVRRDVKHARPVTDYKLIIKQDIEPLLQSG